VQITGTFGGATIALQVSNDGTNYVTLKDGSGSDISLTSAGMREFSTAALYLKPTSSGGTADNVTVTVVLRG
jgi:P pilus assembly chaperone PapD